MIDAKKQDEPGLSESQSPKQPLPSLKQIAVAAAYAVAPLVGLCLIFGLTHFAVSLTGGYVLSMAAASILYMLVDASVKQLTGTLHGPRDTVGQQAATVKFLSLLLGKFVVVGLVAFLIFRVPHINVFGVAMGFVVAQATVVIFCAKFSKG